MSASDYPVAHFTHSRTQCTIASLSFERHRTCLPDTMQTKGTCQPHGASFRLPSLFENNMQSSPPLPSLGSPGAQFVHEPPFRNHGVPSSHFQYVSGTSISLPPNQNSLVNCGRLLSLAARSSLSCREFMVASLMFHCEQRNLAPVNPYGL